MSLSTNQVRLMMLQVADAIIEAEPMLSQADRDLGDGDHGLGMKRGMEAVKAQLGGLDPASVEQVFVTTGTAMMTSMGGASGALFGTVYRAGGKALAGRAAFDSEGLALLLEAALEGVMKRGGAKPGDKTMIDALAPAAAKAREVTAHDLTDAFAAVMSNPLPVSQLQLKRARKPAKRWWLNSGVPKHSEKLALVSLMRVPAP